MHFSRVAHTDPHELYLQPSKPEDIPGEDKHLTSRLRGAAEGALQGFAPVKGIHQHVSASAALSLRFVDTASG